MCLHHACAGSKIPGALCQELVVSLSKIRLLLCIPLLSCTNMGFSSLKTPCLSVLAFAVSAWNVNVLWSSCAAGLLFLPWPPVLALLCAHLEGEARAPSCRRLSPGAGVSIFSLGTRGSHLHPCSCVGCPESSFATLFDANISIRADFLLAKGEPCSYKKEEPSRGRC